MQPGFIENATQAEAKTAISEIDDQVSWALSMRMWLELFGDLFELPSALVSHGVRVTDVAEETLRNVLAIVRDAAPLEPVLAQMATAGDEISASVCAARL